jgi:uncharacterized membrane protein
MPPEQGAWSDEHIDQMLGNLLRIGVILASVVVLGGGVVYLWRHGAEPAVDYRDFQGPQPAFSNSVSGIWASLSVPRWSGFIQLGVLMLIATPVARVVFSLVTFAWQRDWIYVTVTLIVLAVLLYSLFAGQ